MFALCPSKFGAKTHTQDLWLCLVSENQAEISQMIPRQISSTTDQASSASRTHVKRPKVNWWVRHAMHRCPEQVHVEKLPGKYPYKNE